MANILGGSGFGQGQGASILGGGQAGMPRVPWSQIEDGISKSKNPLSILNAKKAK